MRNYVEEIKELTSEINNLNLAKNEKVSQLERVLREQKENKKRESSPILRDQAGAVIKIGDWVIATTSGKFKLTEGTVVRINKWITFEDHAGVKQVRAPRNLLISNHGRKRAAQPRANALSRK